MDPDRARQEFDKIRKTEQNAHAERKRLAVEEAVSKLLEIDLTPSCHKQAYLGKTMSTFYRWNFSQGVSYGGFFLIDLLRHSNLVERLQEEFDKLYTNEDGERFFKVYYHYKAKSYFLNVSWDPKYWDNVDNLMKPRAVTSKPACSTTSKPARTTARSTTSKPVRSTGRSTNRASFKRRTTGPDSDADELDDNMPEM